MKNTTNRLLVLATGILLLSSCAQNADRQKDKAETSSDPIVAKAETSGSEEVSKPRTILFFGNSLTAGYGLDPAQAFPALIQQKIDSLGLPYKTVNAGLSGETSAGGKARIGWVLRQPADIFVLELGANDGLRGIELAGTRKNLQSILDSVKAKNPATQLVVAGMQLPPNLGQKYTSDFREIFTELAQANQAALIPFLLDNVGGIARLNQPDGIHPTAEGHRIVAENVWKVLEPLLVADLKIESK